MVVGQHIPERVRRIGLNVRRYATVVPANLRASHEGDQLVRIERRQGVFQILTVDQEIAGLGRAVDCINVLQPGIHRGLLGGRGESLGNGVVIVPDARRTCLQNAVMVDVHIGRRRSIRERRQSSKPIDRLGDEIVARWLARE